MRSVTLHPLRPLLIALAFLVASHAVANAQEATRPNVLFIGVDDLNDWIGVLEGHPQAKTPNIDRLCSSGTLFTRAYCSAPACNPSRASLMTGIRPTSSGVYLNSQPWREPLSDAITLPKYFQGSGYRAIGSGKMYHGSFPDPESWNEYFPSKSRQKPNDPSPDNRPLNGIPKTAHFDWGVVDAKPTEMGDSQVADWVIGQLEKEHEKPFFLACGFYRPHLPWYVPQQYFDQFPLDSIELPAYAKDDLSDVPPAGVRMARPTGDHRKVIAHDQWKRAVQGYLASCAFTDEMVGRVWDALQASPHRDNTIVVFWTDHGWHLGEKDHWRKFALWEEATRTPLAIIVPPALSAALPAGTTAGDRCDRPVSLLDIYPTLVELCGLPPSEQLEGQSLQPLLEDPGQAWERPALTTHGRGNHAVRTDRWRYIRYQNGDEELYDHLNDELERTNLADDAQYADLIRELQDWLPKEEAAPAPSQR